MNPQLAWNSMLDSILRQRRAAGATWNTIAAELGVTRNVVIARAAKLAIPRFRLPPGPPRAETPCDEIDPARPPLPAGHPISWNAINADTQLSGIPYPLPVFV